MFKELAEAVEKNLEALKKIGKCEVMPENLRKFQNFTCRKFEEILKCLKVFSIV